MTRSTSDSESGSPLTVRLPADLPVLTPPVSRVLLAILVELTTIPVLEGRTDEVIR